MADSPGRHIDIVSSADGDCDASAQGSAGSTQPDSAAREGPVAGQAAASGPPPGSAPPRRLWVGVQFECCGVYTRIYRDPDVPFYEGQCPQCGRKVTMRVGPDGVNSRLFRARPI
ncbi:MAG TPA: hypothetical protein VMV94_16100 [Phycisphaerae bacterium]|nr:hypothetical protein [Phycisphaerae bacterium]